MIDKLLKLTRKWWFYLIIVILNLIILPIATKNFSFSSIGDIISTTLGQSIYSTKWKGFYIPYQIIFIGIVFILLFWKGRIKKYFTGFVALSYILFAVGQNIAVTEKFGISIVAINIIMFSFVSFSWILDIIEQRNYYDFGNMKIKYWWMIILSIFAFWLPIDTSTLILDFNPKYLITSGSSLTFCLTTPLFLTVLTLCLPNVNLSTYRITSFIGILLGLYNMANFTTPRYFWIGALHIPLITISTYCFIISFRIDKIKKVTAHNSQYR